jgi:putative transposase
MKKRFSEEQIIRILKEHETGKKAADIVREYNISEQTFYRWKSKYGGMYISEARHLKQLEEENHQLKELVANLTLDNHPTERAQNVQAIGFWPKQQTICSSG